jgi:hypothetical protein
MSRTETSVKRNASGQGVFFCKIPYTFPFNGVERILMVVRFAICDSNIILVSVKIYCTDRSAVASVERCRLTWKPDDRSKGIL